jgi:hypothetical protein
MQKIKKIYHIFIEYPLDRHREKTTQVVSQNDNEDDLERQIDVQTYERCEYGRSFERSEIRPLYNNYMRLLEGIK